MTTRGTTVGAVVGPGVSVTTTYDISVSVDAVTMSVIARTSVWVVNVSVSVMYTMSVAVDTVTTMECCSTSVSITSVVTGLTSVVVEVNVL